MICTSPLTPHSLSPCSWCHGSKFEPDPELSTLTCTLCDGGGLEIISGNLGPTRTCPEGRPYSFNPGTGELIIVRRRRSESYKVSEFIPDRLVGEKASRAFEVVKQSSGEVYHVRIGGDFHVCDCRGFQSEATAKGDRRAWETGEPMYWTRGCSHLDALATLVNDGVL